MPYLEPRMAPDLEASETVNLKRILELCSLPEVGKSPVDPNLTVELRCTNALTTLEKTSSVFDDAFYQDAVFSGELDEDKLDRHLLDSARRKGVPEEHFPAKCMKNPPPCPTPQLAVTRAAKLTKAALDKSLPELPKTDSGHNERGRTRPSLSLPASFRKTRAAIADRSRATSPVPSFFSTVSKTPTTASRFKSKDALLSLFKRDAKPSPHLPWDAPPPATDVPSLVSSSSRTTIRTSANRNSHLSSSPSASISSRTSTSSVSIVDLSGYSWIEGRTIQRLSRNPGFIILRVRCVNEAKRFVDFAQHQRVALPLFLGRTKLYLEDRYNHKLAELTKKHDRAKEDLENKHLEQEIFESEQHASETSEEAAKNRTALKYIERRIDMLGEAATASDFQIFREEQRAMDRLAERQQRQIRNLHRQQYRERADMLRAQQKELDDLRLDHDTKIWQKTRNLESNARKLEELIHIRSMRLVARWYLMLQIYKTEDKDGTGLKGPLPLSLLGLPEEFAPYTAAYVVT